MDIYINMKRHIKLFEQFSNENNELLGPAHRIKLNGLSADHKAMVMSLIPYLKMARAHVDAEHIMDSPIFYPEQYVDNETEVYITIENKDGSIDTLVVNDDNHVYLSDDIESAPNDDNNMIKITPKDYERHLIAHNK